MFHVYICVLDDPDDPDVLSVTNSLNGFETDDSNPMISKLIEIETILVTIE